MAPDRERLSSRTGDTVTAAQDASRVFRRVGEVTARRLEEDLAWVTQRGDRLQGHAGIGSWSRWTAGSGPSSTRSSSRCMSRSAVTGGDGPATVTAHQVSTPVTVSTLEGVAARSRGLDRDCAGREQLACPRRRFRRSYEPVWNVRAVDPVPAFQRRIRHRPLIAGGCGDDPHARVAMAVPSRVFTISRCMTWRAQTCPVRCQVSPTICSCI